MTEVLSAEDIRVSFSGLIAVDGVSVSVREGQVLGLIGSNGAGKTTLFNVLTGHQPATTGRVRLFGEDVTDLPPTTRARRGVGRTFQLGGLIDDLTVIENVALGLDHAVRMGRLGRIKRADLAATAREKCSRADLGDVTYVPVAELSAGRRRKVEVVRAVTSGARVLLLDEPGAGLSPIERTRLVSMIKDLAAQGTAFIITDHDTGIVFGVSDHVVVMSYGKKLMEGDVQTVRSDQRVARAYLGIRTAAS